MFATETNEAGLYLLEQLEITDGVFYGLGVALPGFAPGNYVQRYLQVSSSLSPGLSPPVDGGELDEYGRQGKDISCTYILYLIVPEVDVFDADRVMLQAALYGGV